MIDSEYLLEFVIKAKKATYVGAGAHAAPSRPGSHDLIFEEGMWSYRDSYFGGTDFVGQETVWNELEPVWAMNYYGYIIRPDLITPSQAGDILKRVLSQPGSQGRLLDNLTAEENPFTYSVSSGGNILHFKGREEIVREGKVAYELVYQGGLIKP